MPHEPEWLDKLNRKKLHLRTWLDRHKSAEEIADDVQEALDFTEWQIDAILSRPDAADEVVLPDLSTTLDSDLAHLEFSLPMMPAYDKEQFLGTSAFTSSGTLSVFDFAARVGDIEEPEAKDYSGKITVTLQDLNERYDRPSEIRKLLERTGNPNTLERFDEAHSSYGAYQRGADKRTALATSMRNLIDGVKGDIWEAAREKPKESMTWEIAARRLARGGPEGPQAEELTQQEKRHSALVSRLSDVLKDRDAGSVTNLDFLWADILSYLSALMGLLDIDAFS